MKKKYFNLAEWEETTLSRLLGPPQRNLDEEPPCASKMSIEDGFVSFELKIYTKYKLLFAFKREWLHEALFKKKEILYAARKMRDLTGVMCDVANEQLVALLRSFYGCFIPPGRHRQKEIVFLLPNTSAASLPAAKDPQPQAQPPSESKGSQP